MGAEQKLSLVARKARGAREAQVARSMSLARALRLTAAKQADRMMGLAVAALGITTQAAGADQIEGWLDPAALTLLMDGSGGQVAAVVMDANLVAALIQQQTMGSVPPAREGEQARKPTSTDAALCAPFAAALLEQAAKLPDAADDVMLLENYRFGVWAEEVRQAQLALEASDNIVVEITLDLAAGARTGQLVLILPKPAKAVPQGHPEGEDESDAPVVNLSGNVMDLNAELVVALTRLRMPIQSISSLAVGDIVDLDLSSMKEALVIDGNHRTIARGTLGHISGQRALQVEQRAAKYHTEPRRRVADREALDLPDVTEPHLTDETGIPAPLPGLGDMDIFGNLDDLPPLPDMEAAAQAADDAVEHAQTDDQSQADVQDQGAATPAALSGW